MIRLANLRHHAMVEAEFRLLLGRNELTKEGEDVRCFYALRLQFDHLINFPAALTLRHVIDENSPLFGLTPEDLIVSTGTLSFPGGTSINRISVPGADFDRRRF